MKKITGKCALCGKEGELTFEHIPPRGSFNGIPVKQVSGEELTKDFNRLPWDVEGLKYTNNQRGSGLLSLCSECNNNTGSWYGEDYVLFTKTINTLLHKKELDKYRTIEIDNAYPLRVIKQIISMFCSINKGISDKLFQPLREFVLDKEKTGLDKKKYKACIYFTKNDFYKLEPYSVICLNNNDNFQFIQMSQIDTYPLIMMLYFDPEEDIEYEGIDITCFSDVGYDDMRTIRMPLILKESNNFFPYDFRTRVEIEKAFNEQPDKECIFK